MTWSKSSYSPPASLSARVNGGAGPGPARPLCTLGLPQDAARELFGSADAFSGWDVSFEMGRALFDSMYCVDAARVV